MIKQNTNTILMVRPVDFKFNDQTAVNNYYQKNSIGPSDFTPNQLAQKEFDDFVIKLRGNGIDVVVIEDSLDPKTPDSIFPNNWVSFHQDGVVAKYPMFAENRRLERRDDVLESLVDLGFIINKVVDFSFHEDSNLFLEGTGSLVLDRQNKIAYAAVSIRTDESVLDEFCKTMDYKKVAFTARQNVNGERLPIYHTNVMMCLGEEYAVICADSIDDVEERNLFIDSLEDTGKEIVYITEDQKHNFAGNMLQLINDKGAKFTVMSSAAYRSLDMDQIDQLQKFGGIIHSSLSTIEQLGGGSARCMMAEVFLPKNK